MSRPSFPFYPDNYMNDAGVRRCSKGTRGIWVDLLCLMHQGTPYGHLAGPAGAHPIKFLGGWCGESQASINAALEELRINGVYSTTADGTIFNRRMVRDEHNRIVRGAGGPKALENENVPRRKDTLRYAHEGTLRTGVGEGKDAFNPKKNTLPISSEKFAVWWKRWVELTNRRQHESDALRAFLGTVEEDKTEPVMACLERYGRSDEVARGVFTNPEKWLYEQARDEWRGDWPPARASPANSPQERLKQEQLAAAKRLGMI